MAGRRLNELPYSHSHRAQWRYVLTAAKFAQFLLNHNVCGAFVMFLFATLMNGLNMPRYKILSPV